MKKFLLADDHVVVRSGISGLLQGLYKPCEVHEAEDGDSTVEKLKQHTFDLVMMDIQMPQTDASGLMDYIHTRYPETKVLIFSMNAENIYAKRYLKAGAKGFLKKDAQLDEIKKAIHFVLNNRKYISESLAESLADASVSDNLANPFDQLSAREFEITTLLLAGQTVSEISQTLNLQVSTIGTHKSRVFQKLKINHILELKELATGYNI